MTIDEAHDFDGTTWRCKRCGGERYVILQCEDVAACRIVPMAERFQEIAARLNQITVEKAASP